MTVFRGMAILIALFLLAPAGQAMAQAGSPPQAEIEHSQAAGAWPARFQSQCPRLCVEWYDGCNICTCGKGKLDVCTQVVCRQRRRPPRCLRWGF
jgi:hypothetical protein